ncbi:glutamine amidotransferase-related protein, partial [Staphylococcus gallinarum]
AYYGGDVIQADSIKHGKTDQMKVIKDTPLYQNMPEYSEIMRYHSLISNPKTFPNCLTITAETADCIQSFEHQSELHFGIQYHPESFATEYGETIIKNFIEIVREAKDNAITNKVKSI